MIRAVAIAAALLSASASAAETKPAKVAVVPGAGDGVIIVRAPLLNIDYDVEIARFDPANSRLRATPFTRYVGFKIKASRASDGFFVSTLPPGDYIVTAVSQQLAWAICFQADTLAFKVGPGDALYLGTFDGQSAVRELQANARSAGDLSARPGDIHHYFDGISPPRFSPIDSAELAEVNRFARSAMPNTRSAVAAVTFQRARFGTGISMHGRRSCGGFFNKKGVPDPS